MKRVILAGILFIALIIILTGCFYGVHYPADLDYNVSGVYQHGRTYIGATYWNYPGYGYYGLPGPICGWNSSGLPLGCNAGPVAPSFLRDTGVLPRPYIPYPYWRR